MRLTIHSKDQWFYLLAVFLGLAVPAPAAILTETFLTTNYRDGGAMTAVWVTAQGRAYHSSSYLFSQPGWLTGWGGHIRATHQKGSVYLVGGVGGKWNQYHGTSWTNLFTQLPGFSNRRINPDGAAGARADLRVSESIQPEIGCRSDIEI